METLCLKVQLKEGCIEQVRNWFNTLKLRIEETKKTLRNEGAVIESVFLDSIGEKNFLIYYIKAKDIEFARSVFKQSTLSIDLYHKKCWELYCEKSIVLQELLDINLFGE